MDHYLEDIQLYSFNKQLLLFIILITIMNQQYKIILR